MVRLEQLAHCYLHMLGGASFQQTHNRFDGPGIGLLPIHCRSVRS